MLMNAEEYVAENSKVPACYNALGNACVLFEHTESGYDIKFCFEAPNINTRDIVHCDTSKEFLNMFNYLKPTIDEWFTKLREIYETNVNLIKSLTNVIDDDSIDRYIETPIIVTVGHTTISLGSYKGELIGFISDYREDMFKTVILTEDSVREIMALDKEWNDYIKLMSEEVEEICR